jgi:TolB protein
VLKKALSTVLIIISFAGSAWAELDITITQGAGKRTPIAVVPFGWTGTTADMPLDIAEVIGNDLSRSGRFAPIGEEDMLQKPTDGTDVDFDDWSILGVEAVIIGRVTQTGENAYSVQFQLFDVFGRDQLVGYRMPASRGTMRRVAHRAADMIYEKLTGIKGVFDTGATQRQRAPVLTDRLGSGWRERVQDHGKHRPDNVSGLVARQPPAGLRVV